MLALVYRESLLTHFTPTPMVAEEVCLSFWGGAGFGWRVPAHGRSVRLFEGVGTSRFQDAEPRRQWMLPCPQIGGAHHCLSHSVVAVSQAENIEASRVQPGQRNREIVGLRPRVREEA